MKIVLFLNKTVIWICAWKQTNCIYNGRGKKNTVKQSAFLTDGHWGSLHLKRRFTPKKRQFWHHLLSLMLLHSWMTCFYRTQMEKCWRIVLILKSWISMQLQRMRNWSSQASKGTQNTIKLNHDSCATFQVFWSHKIISEKQNKIYTRGFMREVDVQLMN